MPLPSLDNLRCFVSAARLLNFRAGAKAVALTPAAFGQRIKQLEDQLGAELFARDTHHVSLTEQGHALLPAALRALGAAEECGRALRGERPPVELVLGTRHELGLSWILPMLPAFRRLAPAVHAHLYFGSGADLLIRVRTLEVDCAVGSMRLDDPRLDGLPLHEERYALVAAPGLLARRSLRTAAEARSHTLLDVNPDLPLYRYFRDAPGAPALEFDRLWRLGAGESILRAVLKGEGVAVLPEYFVAARLKTGALRRVLPRQRLLSDHFRLIFRKDDPRRGVFEALAAAMRAVPLR